MTNQCHYERCPRDAKKGWTMCPRHYSAGRSTKVRAVARRSAGRIPGIGGLTLRAVKVTRHPRVRNVRDGWNYSTTERYGVRLYHDDGSTDLLPKRYWERSQAKAAIQYVIANAPRLNARQTTISALVNEFSMKQTDDGTDRRD